ncbi:hypothetical protein RHGRI_031897 [Rhododendron griersonianum]|uniref:Uncharacterized protein n=1 Tax=Rhododendron griersonianum TaxID=479676 RepID=A0AAV6I777_9ERIC|nr:hypothetical protein RHGRI_031082 [Rhododendron griersonianum]KAG5525383.1 hypothetical protein RHGRI_031897 [Rhododendron griersonianum]
MIQEVDGDDNGHIDSDKDFVDNHNGENHMRRSPAEVHYIKQRQILSFTEDDTDDRTSGDNLRIVDDGGQG